ncbi:MAG: alpha/beta fold hydrolase [Syntrophales bacterium]
MPERPEDRYVLVGPLRIRYQQAGNRGRAVALIHGFGASVEIWERNIQALSAGGHRVYAVDLPGFGRSDKPVGPYDSSFFTRFVDGFLAAVNIEKVTLVGLSMGGGICLHYALHHPEKIEKLVLVDSAGLGRELPLSMRIMSLPLVGEVLTKPSKREVYLFFKPAVLNPAILKGAFTELYYELFSLPGARKALLKVLRSMCNIFGVNKQALSYILSNLHRIKAPTLIIWGRQDAVLPLKHAFTALEKIPGSELHIIEECGHMPNFEKPEEFNRLVLDFLSK